MPTYVLLTLAMHELPNWTEAEELNRKLDYSNRKSKISTFAQTKSKITGKVFLAKLMKNKEFIPYTIPIINKRKIPRLNEVTTGQKWFLKPDNNYGGKGIKVITDPKKIRSLIVKEKTQAYVLQKAVKDLKLYQGHKFDLRIWLFLIYRKGQPIHFYLHPRAGYLRIAKIIYDPKSTRTEINLTNNSFQDKLASIDGFYVNQPYHTQDFYESTMPKIKQISRQLVGKIKPFFQKPQTNGFEIMGLDFLVNTHDQVKLIEINRHLGFPIRDSPDYNPIVRELIINITKSLVIDFLEPILRNEPVANLDSWIRL